MSLYFNVYVFVNVPAASYHFKDNMFWVEVVTWRILNLTRGVTLDKGVCLNAIKEMQCKWQLSGQDIELRIGRL